MYKLYNIEALCIISSEVAINRNCSSRFFITRADTSEFYNYFNISEFDIPDYYSVSQSYEVHMIF